MRFNTPHTKNPIEIWQPTGSGPWAWVIAVPGDEIAYGKREEATYSEALRAACDELKSRWYQAEPETQVGQTEKWDPADSCPESRRFVTGMHSNTYFRGGDCEWCGAKREREQAAS